MESKGVSIEKIRDVQTRLEYVVPGSVDFKLLEDSGVCDIVQKTIETRQKKFMEDTDLWVICELAIKYLESVR